MCVYLGTSAGTGKLCLQTAPLSGPHVKFGSIIHCNQGENSFTEELKDLMPTVKKNQVMPNIQGHIHPNKVQKSFKKVLNTQKWSQM